ncbi:hypothetical protein PCK1_002299 [Pneumocystis canis]|nr:hypothetical protein PCK1_002299 [Pneumocystis canis]
MSSERVLWIIFGSQSGSAHDVAEYFERGARRRLFDTHICAGENFFLYNWSSKKLYRRLLQLGAHSIHTRGEADEQNPQGIDSVLIPWSQELWSILLTKYPLPKGFDIYPDTMLLSSSFSVFLKQKQSPVTYSLDRTNVITVTVSQNLRITSQDHWQDVRHVILDIHDNSVIYHPGDCVVLYPCNPPKEVENFLECMGWSEIADIPLSISPKRLYVNSLIPSEVTLRFLFTNVLDFLSVPRRSFFEFLSHFTNNADFVEKIRYFCTAEGQEDLYDYVNRPRRTILEVIQDFSPLNIPLDYIFDIFPIMCGRKFSIASSLKVNPGQIHLCIAIVKYKTILRKFRYGVCTRWISTLPKGAEIEIGFSSGILRKAKSCLVPVVMVGPGTGVSPLRSLIQERIFEGCKDNILFFGCRSEYKDFLFRDEWIEYSNNNYLILFTAFSRDQKEKRYVQHVMEEHSKGILYLSGNSRFMPEAVKQSFLNILMKEGDMTIEESRSWFLVMKKEGRFLQEIWS